MALVSYETIFNTIRARFDTQVTTPESLVAGTVLFDNDGQKKPKGVLWVRNTILTSNARQVSMGSGGVSDLDRVIGVFTSQVFIPVGGGDKEALQLADKIEAKFKRVTDGAVVFQVPSVIPVGQIDGEHQVNVESPFYVDR